MSHAELIADRVCHWIHESPDNVLKIAKRAGIRQQTLFRISKKLQRTVTVEQFARIVLALGIPESRWKAALFDDLHLPGHDHD